MLSACVLTVLATAVLIYWKSSPTSSLPLPPSPPAHWFFGHVLTPRAWHLFTEYTATYGPIFIIRRGPYLGPFTRYTVIIGRHRAAIEIMERNGAKLADRPRSVAGGEVLSGGMRILLMSPSGPDAKKFWQALHANLQPKMATRYEPIVTTNAVTLLLDILNDPAEHNVHARRYAASTIMTVTYAHPSPAPLGSPTIEKVGRGLARLNSTTRIGAYWIDLIPALRYIPWGTGVRELKEWRREEAALFQGLFDGVKEDMANGREQECFARYLIERQAEFGLSDEESAYLAGSMFGAGSDTTAAGISFAIMAAACYPDAQARVQEELDRVVGRGRLPTFEDRKSLPQVTAFVLESYRWRPVSAPGFAHRAMEDVVWEGYRIPKGVTVMGNHWAISRDPDVYPDPETFNPGRWLDKNGQVQEDPKFYNFGFGRRVCPGLHLANRSLFLNTAMILWAFHISQDPAHPIDTYATSDGSNVHPDKFAANFVPRMNGLRAMVEAAAAEHSSS
ncbi:hypothetical protein PLICRDRAFT_114554 [Plicaturopsis crispa FD-325 SS-3]|nr:hypothetical protein PLICRDRAFT_114554 [Plicaturopsis crispa FD-325 SS-3]